MIDTDRLARAIHLDAEPSGDDVWQVQSGDRMYLVRADQCSCEDARIRSALCKHRLAVRLAALDRDVLSALRRMLPEFAPRRTPSGAQSRAHNR